VGELGRQHIHVASDFDFLHKGWFQDVAWSSRLGFVQFSRDDNRRLRSAARFSGLRVRAATIAHYLSGYMGKTVDDEKPWPWPKKTRLVSSARGALPKRIPAPDVQVSWKSVRQIAIEELGAPETDFIDHQTGEQLSPTSWRRAGQGATAERPPPPFHAFFFRLRHPVAV
jgi:hypothetical protein